MKSQHFEGKRLIPDSLFKYSRLSPNRLGEQIHISDYYALTNRSDYKIEKSKDKREGIRSKKKKGESRDKSEKRKKKHDCLTIGSENDHVESLEKLQDYIKLLNRRKVDQMVDNQKYDNENVLMQKRFLLEPQTKSEETYIKQIEQKSKKVRQLLFLHDLEDKKHESEVKKLNKKMENCMKQLKSEEKKIEKSKSPISFRVWNKPTVKKLKASMSEKNVCFKK